MNRARLQFRACLGPTVVAVAVLLSAGRASADGPKVEGRLQPSDAPAYLTSPYHRANDGNGRIIPCRCRFQGQEFRLGEVVCMSTHVGVVLARCDLMLNNTSWVPTETACATSQAPVATGDQFAGRP